MVQWTLPLSTPLNKATVHEHVHGQVVDTPEAARGSLCTFVSNVNFLSFFLSSCLAFVQGPCFVFLVFLKKEGTKERKKEKKPDLTKETKWAVQV